MHQRSRAIGRAHAGRRRRPRPNRRALRAASWLLVAAGALVGIALALALVRLSGVAGDLRSAREHLDAAAANLEDGRIGDARDDLAAARALLVGANADLYGAPDLAVVDLLPIANTNLHAIRDSVADALGAAGAAERVLRAAAPLEGPNGKLDVSLQQGVVPLDVIADVRDELQSLLASLPLGPAPDSPLLLPQVRELAREVHDSLDARRGQVNTLEQGLTLLEELSGGNGDRRYLIAVANSAEMRGTGGMILSYGVLDGHEGDIELTLFGPIDELFLPAGIDPADADPDELARWGGLEPLRLWRNANLVPDPAVVAPRLEAMAEAAGGVAFDGVIQVDPIGLAALLEGVGPVVVDGLGTVDASNVVDLTLNQAYLLYPDNDERRDVLGDVAEAAFRRLVDGDFPSLRPLGAALAEAAAQRHIALWSDRPAAAQPAASFDADAAIPAADELDHLLVTVQDMGRDKLDYYLDTAVRVRGARPASVAGDLTVDVTLTNTAPPGQTQPAYVFGDPSNGRPGPVGHYLGVASLYVPVGTTLTGVAGGAATAPVLLAEDGRSVIGFDVDVPAGGSVTVTLQLQLPPRPAGRYHLDLVPIPRVRPTSWDVDIDAGDGTRSIRHGPLLRQEIVAPN